jgi:hypothetical protein
MDQGTVVGRRSSAYEVIAINAFFAEWRCRASTLMIGTFVLPVG